MGCAASRQTKKKNEKQKTTACELRVATAAQHSVGGRVDRSAATAIPRPQAAAQQAAARDIISLGNKRNSISTSTSFHFSIAAAALSLLLLLVRSAYERHSASETRSAAAAAATAAAGVAAATAVRWDLNNTRDVMLSRSIGKAVRVQVRVRVLSTRCILHDTRREKTYRSSGPPAARCHNPAPLVRITLKLQYTSRASVLLTVVKC